jgi:hypothetical protein
MTAKRARITEACAPPGGRDPLTPTDKVLDQYEQVNKSSSQFPAVAGNEKQQSTSLTSTQVDKLVSQQSKKSLSQQVNNLDLTSQQANNLTSEEVAILRPTDGSLEAQLNNSASQKYDKLTSEQANITEFDQGTSQLADNQIRQQAHNPVLRKATFQVDGAILDALDRYHLQLQIELGKRNAPYKEILVEEAIAQWLERATKSPDRVVKSLLKRQEQRSV